MNKGYVPASPRLTRLVQRALLAWVAVLMIAAAFVPAPLQHAADPGHAPNPARSAWFLLWIQELVSHDTAWMWVAVAVALALVSLPWLRRSRATSAQWFAKGERIVGLVSLAAALAILALTVVAWCFRGEQWRFVAPF